MLERLIDANLNRAREGLRVLEDLARFLLQDSSLAQRLRSLRHELEVRDPERVLELLRARDAGGDPGAIWKEAERRGVFELGLAAFKRTQEALRALEEAAKIESSPLDGADAKRIRFALYDIEREMLPFLLRKERSFKISGLYVILDQSEIERRGWDLEQLALDILRAGAGILQLRDKKSSSRAILERASKLAKICRDENALFIVNDHADIAAAAEADGVHLGEEDLPVRAARKVVGEGRIIGATVRSSEDAIRAWREGADYIAVGSIYPSPTKPEAPVVGLRKLSEIREAIPIPVVAIGGINEENIEEVLSFGADAAAVVGAVIGADDPRRAAERLVLRAGKWIKKKR